MRPIKPPIGVLNRILYKKFLKEDIEMNGGMCLIQVNKQRLNELRGAIERYALGERLIPVEWVREYNELLNP